MNVLLAVTGGIAAYKTPELVRRLREQGHAVKVLMTESAKQFVTPLTLQAVSGESIYENLFDGAMPHIELARWADLIAVAPATANTLAKIAAGRADDLLTNLILASEAVIAVAPAMNQAMWHNSVTQANLALLQARGILIWGPAAGEQACGDVGLGRMLEVEDLLAEIDQQAQESQQLVGKHILVTAGPTREFLDPIRYFSNTSSGKMGYAIAEAAQRMGAKVTLISGPVQLVISSKVNKISVTTAQEMHDAVMQLVSQADIFISAAAVADYRPEECVTHKIKKSDGALNLFLVRNPDILSAVSACEDRPYLVGFAAESDNLIENAKRKLQQKNLDMIVANPICAESGFSQDENQVTILTKCGEQLALPLEKKTRLASRLMKLVACNVSALSF